MLSANCAIIPTASFLCEMEAVDFLDTLKNFLNLTFMYFSSHFYYDAADNGLSEGELSY